jgi:hypothetical protein
MKQTLISILLGISAGLSLPHTALSDGFSWHLQGGQASANFKGSTQAIEVAPTTVNTYTVNSPSQTDPFLGVGAGYQMDYEQYSINWGVSALYTETTAGGINSPSSNMGNFDTLTYSATGNSYALMLEPKFIWTAHRWQPYLLAGLGVAFNAFGNYQERLTNSYGTSAPTITPFNDNMTTELAYEIGFGVQHTLSVAANSPWVALDYRFMNWGNTELDTYAGQPNNKTLNLGQLQTQAVSLSLIWPF